MHFQYNTTFKRLGLSLIIVFNLVSCSESMPPDAEQAIVQSFNPNLYLGTWYEIARLDNSFEKGLQQVTAHYSAQSDGTIKVLNRGFNPQENKWHEAVGTAKFVHAMNADGSRTGRLKVSFFRPFYGEYNILEVDKPDYQYALMSSGRDYLWILSRTPQLSDAIRRQLVTKAKQLGFSTEQLLFIRQINQAEHKPG